MKYVHRLLLLIAVLGGAYLSLIHINPHDGAIELSEAVLQLSGSRGGFALGFSYSELASFAMCLFPGFLIEAFAGIMLYRHFCTASTYVFSRYPHRVRWYLREAGRLGGAVCGFHVLLLAVAMLAAAVRYELRMDSAGIMLLAYHFLIHSLWVYVMALSVNLLAVRFGSSAAYALVVSGQLACVVLMNIMDLLVRHSDGRLTYESVLRWNPIARLVLGWHSSGMEGVNQAPSLLGMDLNGSLTLFLLLGAMVTFLGVLIMRRHDLLVSDLETEV